MSGAGRVRGLSRPHLAFFVFVVVVVIVLAAVFREFGPGTFGAVTAIVAIGVSLLAAFSTIQESPELSFGLVKSWGNRVRIPIENSGPVKARSCYAKLTVHIQLEDLLPIRNLGGYSAFVSAEAPGLIERCSTAWEQVPNLPRIDIDAGDAESLMVARLLPIQQQVVIEIPSEQGESVPGAPRPGPADPSPTKARAFLRPRKVPYDVDVRVGSEGLGAPITESFLLGYDSASGRLTLERAKPRHWRPARYIGR